MFHPPVLAVGDDGAAGVSEELPVNAWVLVARTGLGMRAFAAGRRRGRAWFWGDQLTVNSFVMPSIACGVPSAPATQHIIA